MILALALMVLGQMGEPCYRVPRAGHGCGMRATGRAGADMAFFEAFPTSGAGTTSACSTTVPTGAKGETLTFTRASVAECYSNDGQTLTQMASGVPRVSSGSTLSSWLGIWADPSAINSALHGRDLSNAVWTKTNMTCVKNATGMRNDANGASTCTATAANATVCQTVTTAAASRTSSWNLKRSVGTGAVTFARDGATYAAPTAGSLSSTLWRRAVPQEVHGCAGGNCIIVPSLTGSVLNPQVCIKLATSGDAVLVDFVQDEAGSKATSPIETAGVAFPRAAEVSYFEHAALATRSMSAVFQVAGSTTGVVLWETSGPILQIPGASGDRSGFCFANGGVFGPIGSYWYLPFTASFGVPASCSFGTASTTVYTGNTPRTTASAVTPAATTRLYVGSDTSGASQIGGVVKGVKQDGTIDRGLWVGTVPNAVAWVGDSITWGNAPVTGTDRPPAVLGSLTVKYVQNLGIAGNTAAQCLTNFRDTVKGKGFTTLIVMCGVNDLQSGTSAAATYASLETLYNEARADGLRLILVGISPWGSYVNSSPAKQTQSDALNVLISDYATTHSLDFVSTASLGAGSPLALTAPNDSGDGLHPNAVGSAALAALVFAVSP